MRTVTPGLALVLLVGCTGADSAATEDPRVNRLHSEVVALRSEVAAAEARADQARREVRRLRRERREQAAVADLTPTEPVYIPPDSARLRVMVATTFACFLDREPHGDEYAEYVGRLEAWHRDGADLEARITDAVRSDYSGERDFKERQGNATECNDPFG